MSPTRKLSISIILILTAAIAGMVVYWKAPARVLDLTDRPIEDMIAPQYREFMDELTATEQRPAGSGAPILCERYVNILCPTGCFYGRGKTRLHMEDGVVTGCSSNPYEGDPSDSGFDPVRPVSLDIESLNCYRPGNPQQLMEAEVRNDPQAVIRTEQEYREYFQQKGSSSSACAGATLPGIDFSQYSLLGIRVYFQGCETGAQERVIRNDALKELWYEFETSEGERCEMPGVEMGWVLIPAVPPDYLVMFVHSRTAKDGKTTVGRDRVTVPVTRVAQSIEDADADACARKTTPIEKFLCYTDLVAVKYNNVSACDTYLADLGEGMRDMCYRDFATKTFDRAVCQQVEKDKFRWQCSERIGKHEWLFSDSDTSAQNTQDACNALPGMRFRSVDTHKVGLGPYGYEFGYWYVSFQNGHVSWDYSDAQSGAYACKEGYIEAVMGGRTVQGEYDHDEGTLRWRGGSYQKIVE